MLLGQLTHMETDLFAKGLNFSITSKTPPNKHWTTNIVDKKKWVINLPSRQLTHFETHFLVKGLIRLHDKIARQCRNARQDVS